MKLFRIAARIAAKPPRTYISGIHIYKQDILVSSVPESWKKIFLDILKTRDEILLSIPDKFSVTSFTGVKRLEWAKGNLIREVYAIIELVKSEVPLEDWQKYEKCLEKLAGYEFMISQDLPYEASDWVYEVHGLVSKMFRIIEASYDQYPSNEYLL